MYVNGTGHLHAIHLHFIYSGFHNIIKSLQELAFGMLDLMVCDR
jgi:hypothetical protein